MRKREKGIILRRLIQSYISSVISISLVLLIVGLIGILAVNAKSVSDYFRESIKLSVIFESSTTEGEAMKFSDELSSDEFVKKTEFISRERGTKEMQELLGSDFLEVFDFNPVPLSVDIHLKADYLNSDSLELIESRLMEKTGVKEVVYQRSLIDIINKNMERISLVLAVLLGLLLFISFVLINNTVRLNVFAKRFTIKTMKLVGAKRSFIRKPFIKRAALQGLVSGLISASLLLLMLYFVKRDLHELYQIFDTRLLLSVLAGVVATGMLICVVSTYFVVNKLVAVSADKIYY
ncbi:MAG: permease-like cell division protein FtsX [Bacteroidales bacterium]|nr:permease-like cell division protein FtsX [Bacteroidales bacterium]MDD2425025.1 permease-like cell division protein FtsX [Bacteroidales bacterium]MDD3989334.1 permease-like cell division protein FtsX [Bacteroidales bacterium]MDD4638688.1 permease-like cell division protein FtsX [Bacteroidales bacterium]